jgi:hypothetical protein
LRIIPYRGREKKQKTRNKKQKAKWRRDDGNNYERRNTKQKGEITNDSEREANKRMDGRRNHRYTEMDKNILMNRYNCEPGKCWEISGQEPRKRIRHWRRWRE